jgi:antitoxin HicB
MLLQSGGEPLPVVAAQCRFYTEFGDSVLTELGYRIIFEPLIEGGYSVIVPSIAEICTFGETLEEARKMARDAIRCFLESAHKTGEPIPADIA